MKKAVKVKVALWMISFILLSIIYVYCVFKMLDRATSNGDTQMLIAVMAIMSYMVLSVLFFLHIEDVKRNKKTYKNKHNGKHTSTKEYSKGIEKPS